MKTLIITVTAVNCVIGIMTRNWFGAVGWGIACGLAVCNDFSDEEESE